jgi:predicted site-specific integrase-resolvase
MKTKVSSREELIRIVNEAPDGSDLNHLDISGIDSLEEVLNKSFEEELVKDILTLMSSFSNKIYGKRSATLRKKSKK